MARRSSGRDEVRLHPGGPGESCYGASRRVREKDQAAVRPWGDTHSLDLSDSTHKAQKTGRILV